MIEPIKQSKGVSRAKVICDDCGKSEVFACAYSRLPKSKEQQPKEQQPNEGQLTNKARQHGWSLVKGQLRCSTCEAKRKVIHMADVKSKKAEPAHASREPTRAQKREIMDLLDEVYDTDAECYRRGDTDETVADVLSVMPGWVAQLREEFFGPDGANEDMEALAARLADAEEQLANELRRLEDGRVKVEILANGFRQMRSDLAAIRKAVGKRVMARAK